MAKKKKPYSPEDELKAESEVLKLKLEMEHGMNMSDTGNLPPEIENEFLNSVYEFENAFKNAKRVKIYDFIGKPAFRKVEELSKTEIKKELKRLEKILEKKKVHLDRLCEYDDETIYRFITGEFFEHEIDDMQIAGMGTHFIYEEFHPNHPYDLERMSNDFIRNVLEKEWDEEFHSYEFAHAIIFREVEYDRKGISSVIKTFQEAHKSFKVKRWKVKETTFDLEKETGSVSAYLSYEAVSTDKEMHTYKGKASIDFKRHDGYWGISGFSLPGFGD